MDKEVWEICLEELDRPAPFGQFMYFSALYQLSHSGQRRGQSFFNAIALVYGNGFANQIPAEVDPFNDDARMQKAVQWVHDRLEDYQW